MATFKEYLQIPFFTEIIYQLFFVQPLPYRLLWLCGTGVIFLIWGSSECFSLFINETNYFSAALIWLWYLWNLESNFEMHLPWPSWSWWSTSPVLPKSPGKGCWWWWQLQGPLCQEKFSFQDCLSFPESCFPCFTDWIGCTAWKWKMEFLSAFPLPLATSKIALWCNFNY